MTTIRILALADGTTNDLAGGYLKAYDPDAYDGAGHVEVTFDEADALHFASAAEALELWRRTSTVRPVRRDGKPNRPLTAYTITVA